MKEIDKQNFFGFVCMSANQFNHLLEHLKSIIMEKHAAKAPIPSDERLVIALRLMVKVRHYQPIILKFVKATVCERVEEVCEAIWKHTMKAVPTN